MATSTIRLELRSDKIDKEGKAPIRIVYQISGQRKFLPTSVKCIKANWNKDDQKIVYLNKKAARKIDPQAPVESLLSEVDVNQLNGKLNSAIDEIREAETVLKLEKKTITPDTVFDIIKKRSQPEAQKDQPKVYVVDFIKQLVKDSTETHTKGTLKVYTGLAALLAAFEKQVRQRITFEMLDRSLWKKFANFLLQPRKRLTAKGKEIEIVMNDVTAAKQLSTLKTLLKYAKRDYKVNVSGEYRDFDIPSRRDSQFEVIALSQDEFTAIYNLDLADNKRLDQVRDVFCFSAATGLRYSDLQQLRREHIRKDNTIKMTAAKTAQKLSIPLNPFSYSILKKYSDQRLPLPMISNQKTNDYLKEIGEMAGIDTPIEKVRSRGVKKIVKTYKKYELLSIHVGRKSFITLSLEKGIAIQEVMSLSGHTTFKAFKRYVDVSDSRKKTVMAETWGVIKDSKLKAV